MDQHLYKYLHKKYADSEGAETPHDPMGFMKRIQQDAPFLESETFEILNEALDCWLHRHLRSAAVMVGLASENEILRLIELYSETLSGSAKQKFQSNVSRRNISTKFDELYKRLYQNRGALPADIQEIDAWLRGTFQIIRLSRNEAGHLSGQTPHSDEVYSNLYSFRTYARRISGLKEHLGSRSRP